MNIPIPQKSIEIIHGYEGLGGESNSLYYPFQGAADKPGVLTIGRGHVLSNKEKESGTFDLGLTIEEVDKLFSIDVQVRAKRLKNLIPDHTEDEFAAALSFFYNIEYAWGPEGSPGNFHREGNKLEAARSFLLYINSGRPLKKRLGLWRRRATEALCYLTGRVLISKSTITDMKLINSLDREDISTSPP